VRAGCDAADAAAVWERQAVAHKVGRTQHDGCEWFAIEAHEANAAIASGKKARSLAERLSQGSETVRDLLAKMPTEGMKHSSILSFRSIDKKIAEALGDIQCAELTTKDIARFIEAVYETGKHRTALKIRSRLMKVCKRGIALGWMSSNPAEATEQMKVKVRRSRLTMETFLRILDKAPQVNSWIGNAMLLALVSGQDRSTVARWPRSSIEGDVAIVHRTKTEVRIAIPLDLGMDAIGMTLRDVIAKCRSTHVVSQYIVHHTTSSGPMRRGDPVSIKSVSVAFTAARRLAGIPDEGAPTFHEIRSLAKRTYVEQGNVDTKALLGHMSDSAANLYADPRGIAPIKVRIG
jgi:ubiquinone biosynthesis protein UbiJ